MNKYHFILTILLLTSFTNQSSPTPNIAISVRNFFSKLFIKKEIKRRLELQKKIDTYAQSFYGNFIDQFYNKNTHLAMEGRELYLYLEFSKNPIFLAVMRKDYAFALEILPELTHFNMMPSIMDEKFKFIMDWSGWYGAKPEFFKILDLLLTTKEAHNPLRYQLIEKLIKYTSKDDLVNYIRSKGINSSNKVIEGILWNAADCDVIETVYKEVHKDYDKATFYKDMLEQIRINSTLYNKNCNFK